LLHLAMHDYLDLVSGALQLLLRHFSQRQEVLQAFKQVSVCPMLHNGLLLQIHYVSLVKAEKYLHRRSCSSLFSLRFIPLALLAFQNRQQN
jgi:hypothetical protein